MRKPKYKTKDKVPFLLCLKCYENLEEWSALLKELNKIQKNSGGDSLSVESILPKQSAPVPEIPTEELTEQKILAEMESNTDIKARMK